MGFRNGVVELHLGSGDVQSGFLLAHFIGEVGGKSKCLAHGLRNEKWLFRFQLAPAVDDGQPVFHRVTGHHQIALTPGEKIAGLLLVLGVPVGVQEFLLSYFCLFKDAADVDQHVSVRFPGDLRD